MVHLLSKVFHEEIINADHRDLLLSIMRRCKTGPTRLMGLLPKNTPVAHKTGTATGYNHDVGYITLPDNAGHIAIAVFIKESNTDTSLAERAIAEVARTIYDFFLY